MVEAGKLDMSLGACFKPSSAIRRTPLFRFSLMVIRPDHDPAVRRTSNTWSALKGERDDLAGTSTASPTVHRQAPGANRCRPPPMCGVQLPRYANCDGGSRALPLALTQASIGNSTEIKFPSTSSFSRFPQPRRPIRIRRPPPAATRVVFRRDAVPAWRARFFAAPHSSRAHNGPSAAIPDRFKNVRLSMELGILPRLPGTPLNRDVQLLKLKDSSHRAISGFYRHSGFASCDIWNHTLPA